MTFAIRPYRRNDRQDVRRICCETGFMGNPVDPIFDDRDIFADFFTRYYTDWEAESCLVAECEGEVVGYLTGCTRHVRYALVQAWLFMTVILPKIALRLVTFRYGRKHLRFFSWFLLRGRSETPNHPGRSAHFHINLLRPWRRGTASRRMIFAFIDSLRARGVRRVYGQIQTYSDRRPARIFQRYGFEPFDRREITRFKGLHADTVYVTTFVKELA